MSRFLVQSTTAIRKLLKLLDSVKFERRENPVKNLAEIMVRILLSIFTKFNNFKSF